MTQAVTPTAPLEPEEIVAVMVRALLTTPRRVRQNLDVSKNLLEAIRIVNARQNEIQAVLNEIRTATSSFTEWRNLIEQQVKNNERLTEQYHQHRVIEPMARRIIPLYDLAHGQCGESDSGGDGDDVPPLARAVRAELLELLGDHGVTAIQPGLGIPFDPKTMNPVRCQDCHERQRDRCIARLIRCGFFCNQRLIRPAMVEIFHYVPSLTPHQEIST
ncbi:MAG: nucleotide exchange factor GrpE [Phycisphaeraceae bacterium]|nr:nucleotide exchange factor GrpE [Phycisphaeraceae bacterium]